MSEDRPSMYYDPKERDAEKQRTRDRDLQDLASGKVSREELAARNGKFAFPHARIEFAKAKALS